MNDGKLHTDYEAVAPERHVREVWHSLLATSYFSVQTRLPKIPPDDC